MERSGARSGGSRSGNGAGSGGYRIRLEFGAAFSPAPLRSHALVVRPCLILLLNSRVLERKTKLHFRDDSLEPRELAREVLGVGTFLLTSLLRTMTYVTFFYISDT